MAKLNKKQRRAVKKAGGNISKKEVKQLKSLGISKKQVKNQAAKNNQKVRNKPAPAPKPKTAGPNKQVKAVRQATSDGRVTKKEASQLRDLGVKKSVTNQLRDQSKLNTSIGGVNVGSKLKKGEVQALKDLGFNGPEILASATAKNIKVGGPARNRLDGTKAAKDAAKRYNKDVKFGGMSLAAYQAQFKPTETPMGRPGAQYGTRTVPAAMDPDKNLLASLYESNPYLTESEIFRAAASAGITNVDSKSDIKQIKQYLAAGNGGGVIRQGGGGSGGSYGEADRQTGDYDDIIDALREDINKGTDVAQQYDEMAVPGTGGGGNNGGGNGGGGNGGNNSLAELTALITATQGGGGNGGGTPLDQIGTLAEPEGPSTADVMDGIGKGLQTQIDTINEGLNAIPNTLNDLLDVQRQENQDTNAAMLASLQSANTAFADQQRIAGNIAKAYVPGANPSAALPAIGDQRSSNRDVQNNRLSDLTVLSGIGKQRNPLVGLQLS